MKVLAVLLLCAFAAVQGRSAVAEKSTALAALGENPYLVHLRIAVSTSGLLQTCSGSLIDARWVLTSASCVDDVRFIWVRYGLVYVISPSMVTETSTVIIKSANSIALVSLNRNVQSSDVIAPVALAGANVAVPETANFCAFGESDNTPGEVLSCYQVSLAAEEDGAITVTSEDVAASKFDIGAPLVSDGVQVAVLVGAADGDQVGTFLPITDSLLDWINEQTGVASSSGAVKSEPDADSLIVKVVN